MDGQQVATAKISFNAILGNNKIILGDSVYRTENGAKISIQTLKFYITGIQLLQNNRIVFVEKNSFHLIDVADTSSQNILLKLPKNIVYNTIQFNLGIDSTTNVSGAMGGDLDPTKGMYWAWQSGYINFKLEGNYTNSKNISNEFEFHIGGYQNPYAAIQTVTLKAIATQNIQINLDIKRFLSAIELEKQKNIMSPGADAVKLAQQLAKCFSIP